jgi:hypothetical protein
VPATYSRGRENGGGRTLAFCVMVIHADFMADSKPVSKRAHAGGEVSGKSAADDKIPAHYRVRNDNIDSVGTVTVRQNRLLHHIAPHPSETTATQTATAKCNDVPRHLLLCPETSHCGA